MKRILVKEAICSELEIESLILKGWVKTKRVYKDFAFIELNDGSCLKNIQIVVPGSCDGFHLLPSVNTGASLKVSGKLVPSKGKGQKWEVMASSVIVYGEADESYPLQKKRHSPEFLREIAHLRPRSNLFGAVFRIRSRLSYAIHSFFQNKNFIYVHTPVITGSDCEGAGELFQVTTLDLSNVPLKEGKTSFEEDFFGKPAYLTVSGQLEGEAFATAFSNIYTFGPTFRAENSNTPRHVSEFWMVEPEMAFYNLNDNMDLAEEFIKYLVKDILEHGTEDLALLNQFVDKDLQTRLELTLTNDFERMEYKDAIRLLDKSGKTFEFPVCFGVNLQTEHERYLTEEILKKPLILYNYPREIKPFYMKVNDDGITVGAMDVLVPKIGEIIGGSQREERLEVLIKRMEETGLRKENYWWYLDTRRFGTVPHSGFGLGLERMTMFVTGVSNIRDVIPFPRTPKNLEF